MGINERKERERAEMRELILKAALELFIEKGFENVSIRNIADRIEYSPTTIYLYFKDKQELLHQIHDHGFSMLSSYFVTLAAEPNPFERLRLMGLSYIKFATENQELYELMFVQQNADEYLAQMGEDWDQGGDAFGILKHNVEECMRAGQLPLNNVEVYSFYIWSSLHGMIMLNFRQRCISVLSEEFKKTMLIAGFELFFNNLRLITKP